MGIEQPNAMQMEAWESDGRRLVILSPTGSGKTLAFGGAMLRRIKESGSGLQAVVLAPSRELAIQIAEVIRRLAAGYKTAVLYGNHPMADEVASLGGKPDIVVATPGRFLDHLLRDHIDTSTVTTLVIDEYDKCLELGFHDEMRRIARRLGNVSDVVLTSATSAEVMPDFIDMTGVEIVDNQAAAPDVVSRTHIAHVESPARDKIETLEELLLSLPPERVIIFVNHRESAERVYDHLRRDGFAVGLYHGGLDQDERERAVIKLDNDTTPILVATDLAGRGLDIEDVGAVIHYHLPSTAAVWTHRNGRTSRVDRGGNVYVITAEGDNIPEYVRWDNDLAPRRRRDKPERARRATYYINAGRREKISRGDIAGYLMKTVGLAPEQVGKIEVRDHGAYVAVDRTAMPLLSALEAPRIKGKRVRISQLK